MPKFQYLPSIRECQIVICRRCKRSQFSRNSACLHCHHPLEVEYLDLELGASSDSRSEEHHKQLAGTVGALLRSLRKRRGICQSDLARMARGTGRSYLSKAECGRVLLRLDKLLTLLQTLGLTGVILRFEKSAPKRITKPNNSR